ncbi:M28 family peptidase [Prolixibacter bellariivorans]|nr:M28 family peptidase [Prolixibacter bellariivorans]
MFSIFLLFLNLTVFGQKPKEKGLQAITMNSVKSPVQFLASDQLEGRMAGSKQGQTAGEYVASLFRFIGLEPMGDSISFTPNRYQKLLGAKPEKNRSFFQPFQAIEVAPDSRQELALITTSGNATDKKVYANSADFRITIPNGSCQISAPVMFVGYGLTDKKSGYDDFNKTDVKGKIVVRWFGLPGDKFPNSSAAMEVTAPKGRALERLKNKQAKEHGALAVLEVATSDQIRQWNANQYYYHDAMYEGVKKPESFYDKRVYLPDVTDATIPVIRISPSVFKDMMGKDFQENHARKNASELKAISQTISGKKIELSVRTKNRRLQLRNVLGRIEGKEKNKFIIIGAHYDHLGTHNGYIWNGADDNASGVSAVLNIAKAMLASGIQPEYTVLFACWDGEERGLLGSHYFVNHWAKKGEIMAYLNFDMIGRNAGPDAPDNQVTMIYSKAFLPAVTLSKQHISDYSLNLDVSYSGSEKPDSGSDNVWFVRNNVPLFWFHTGGHPDYHQPTDQPEMINYTKMASIIRLSYLDIFELSTNPDSWK